MKKKLKKAQQGTVMGAEQGAGAKALRTAGMVVPTVGGGIAALVQRRKAKKAKQEAQKYTNEKLQSTQEKNKEGMKDFERMGGSKKSYKTGGMVNSNAKVSALKSAGSKGVKSGVNTKVSAQKSAKGRVGGVSKAPKSAAPKGKK